MNELIIPYDRPKLMIQMIGYFVLLVVLFVLGAILPLDPLAIFLLLTVCWFVGKAWIRSIVRFFKHKPICILRKEGIELALPNGDGVFMKWKELDKVAMKQKHHRLQYLLYGDHIDHPSGVYLITIDVLFHKEQLQRYEKELNKQWKKHNIPLTQLESKVPQYDASTTNN